MDYPISGQDAAKRIFYTSPEDTSIINCFWRFKKTSPFRMALPVSVKVQEQSTGFMDNHCSLASSLGLLRCDMPIYPNVLPNPLSHWTNELNL
jgi:hypothetical protein